ncbi:Uncharacterized protein TCM_020719 [Theobroma cacao]|uniref:Sulfotransferase n=1 Tax=Theobroma cacao TaxID=3641 RepID=A0A061ELB6_THECC|nr:Uncharacterized protein TCM_020719 [Theobroma cacao]
MKTGTVWLKALSFSIATRTQFNNSISPLQTTFTPECIPFLDYVEYAASQVQRFPLLATHVPYTCLPKSATGNNIKELKEGDLISVEQAFELYCKEISLWTLSGACIGILARKLRTS